MRDDVKSCVTHNAFLTSAVIQSIHRVCMDAEVKTWDYSFLLFLHFMIVIDDNWDGEGWTSWCAKYRETIRSLWPMWKYRLTFVCWCRRSMLTCIFLFSCCRALFYDWITHVDDDGIVWHAVQHEKCDEKKWSSAVFFMANEITHFTLISTVGFGCCLQQKVLRIQYWKKECTKTWRAISSLTDVVLIDLNIHANFT